MRAASSGRLRAFELALVAAILFVPTVSGAECTLPAMKTAERPDPAGKPTPVSVGIWLVDVTAIDDVHQQITADFLVYQTWKDSRLAGLVGCRFSLADVWSPGLDFLNSGRVFPGFGEHVTVGPGGTVQSVQRYRGSLSFPHHLDEFPFDSHQVRISMVPVDYPASEVVLEVDAPHSGREPELTIPDWMLGEPRGKIGSLRGPLGNVAFQYDLVVGAKRRPWYFVWKVIVPLTLIVAMSWTVFWINPAQFGPQIGMSATSMLTLIAFQFATANILPRLSYFTVLDEFITASTVLVFLALLEALTTSYLVSQDRRETAMRIDRVCRWMFPLAFALIVLLVLVRSR